MEERFKTFTILIANISRSIRKIKTAEMAEFDLKSHHVSCLYYLHKANTLTAKELCDICAEDKANISRSIRDLETAGYLSRSSATRKRYQSPIELTEKGEALTEQIKALMEDGDEAKVEESKAVVREIMGKLPLANLNLAPFQPEKLNEMFNSPKWAKLSEACLGCGTCTFVCPTCQCYDIRDYDTGHGIQRFRCWDSCMYSDFTMMAHGTNRPDQMQRFRQRFMHKLIYFPSNNDGMYSCVGCGRCVSKCPISMNIAKVIKALGEDKDE